jgi:hypothetical protein
MKITKQLLSSKNTATDFLQRKTFIKQACEDKNLSVDLVASGKIETTAHQNKPSTGI